VPSFRKLPSGLWQGIVYLPNRKRTTKTDKLKKVVQKWAYDLEADIEKGQWRDPRAGRISLGEWAVRWRAARVVEPETVRGDNGQFKHHILPRWEAEPIMSIRRLDVQGWIRKMEKDGVGLSAIRRSYNLLSKMLGDAVLEGLINETPCVKIDLPSAPPKIPTWFTRSEVDRIEAELPAGHAAMVELMVYTGLRWGEAAGCAGNERNDGTGNPVDWFRKRIRVRGAIDQKGKWKEYPKTSKSRREVPAPQHVLDGLSPLLAGRAPDAWLFVASRCSPGTKRDPVFPVVSGANWRVVWYKAIDAANVKTEAANRKRPPKERENPVPRYDPHDCRHTAASWLVQEGVPLYNVQALLGHESSQTTQRYAHLQPDAHGMVERAWEEIITHHARTARERSLGTDS